jgi:hypothetical protein
MFHSGSVSGTGGSSSHPDSQKKLRREKEVLETDFNKDYKGLYAREVLPTKWVDEEFLTA